MLPRPTPLPVLRSWTELPSLLARLRTLSAEELDEMQRRTARWYHIIKQESAVRVAAEVAMSFASSRQGAGRIGAAGDSGEGGACLRVNTALRSISLVL